MPGKPTGLEELKELLADGRTWITVGKILQLELAKDRSVWRALVQTFPDGEELIARMTWPQVAPNAGMYGPASVNDLVLVALADADEDQSYVIARLSSAEDLIPKQAEEGHSILKAISGKKMFLASDTGVFIGKGDPDAEADEPLVLGAVLQTLLSDVLTAIATHTHTGNLGAPTTPPLNAATFTGKKTSPVDDGLILSDIAFTEKGS